MIITNDRLVILDVFNLDKATTAINVKNDNPKGKKDKIECVCKAFFMILTSKNQIKKEMMFVTIENIINALMVSMPKI